MTHHKHVSVSTDLAPEEEWTKSSYSSQDNGNCIETTVRSATATRSGLVGIRDSKDKTGPALVVPAATWNSFLGLVRSGDVDFGVVDRA
ncbi:DUF397 domain-containing protein [Streptomyces sp. NPDC001250]|uniref:DUF397 domain-containing protein n=1 Tax=Streptomyces sp. NPDC001250 TaxID=3154382 RepID=UPI0033210B80